MYKIPDNKILLLFFAPAILLFIILLLLGQSFIFSLIFLVIFCVFAIAFVANKTGLFLLLLLRPCLDYFTDQSFSLAGLTVNFAGIFAVLAIIFCLFVVMKNIGRFKRLPLASAWIFFLVALAASLITSVDVGLGITELLRLLSTMLIFFASFILIESNRDLADLIKVIIVSALIPSLVAVYQYFTKTGLTVPFEGVYNRVFGTFAHPNLLAFYLLLVLALCFVIFLVSDKKKISVLLYASAAGLFLITLAFTYTRSAWLGLLILVIMLGITRYRKFLIIALLFLSLSYFSIEQINARVQSFANNDPSSSIQWRLQLWQDSFGYFLQKPLLGYGVGTSNEIILQNRGPQAGSPDAHNDYLRIALDAGLIGLFGFLFLIIALLSSLIKIYHRQNKPRLKTLSFVVLMLAGGFYLIGFGDNILANTALQWALWAILGGSMAAQKNLLFSKS
ncbi:MAG: O-antigen ligase family protein [Patescibacteria group bacterium]|nr:O-antigen ligase family protein [Patescibacteria group bacterium]